MIQNNTTSIEPQSQNVPPSWSVITLSDPSCVKLTLVFIDGFPSSGAFEAINSSLQSNDADRKDAIKKGQAIFAFKLKNDAGKEESWYIDLKDKGEVVKGQPKKADVTLSLSDQNFGKLVTGKAQAQQLFMSGKLKVKGNIMKGELAHRRVDHNGMLTCTFSDADGAHIGKSTDSKIEAIDLPMNGRTLLDFPTPRLIQKTTCSVHLSPYSNPIMSVLQKALRDGERQTQSGYCIRCERLAENRIGKSWC